MRKERATHEKYRNIQEKSGQGHEKARNMQEK